jgi:hypothetical protein
MGFYNLLEVAVYFLKEENGAKPRSPVMRQKNRPRDTKTHS